MGSSAAVALAAAAGGIATYAARRVVSPQEAEQGDDVEIIAVNDEQITLRADVNTLSPGRYGIWFNGVRGHLRVGEIQDHDAHSGVVQRSILGIDAGRPGPGTGRWNQYYYAGTPAAAVDLAYEDVVIDGPRGPLPAWFVPASAGVPARNTWVIMVHGRGATREEALRALPLSHRLGFAALVVSYRNDADAVAIDRTRYHLGASEWEDVEAAIVHALAAGADDVVLMAWSMGGAITMQVLDRSWTASRVRSVILDAPVLDWHTVLDHQARINRVPVPLSRLAQRILSSSPGHRLAALEIPLDLASMNWVERASEITVPMLILHSDDDDFVPSGPSRALAQARPDLVHLVSSSGARHTKEWNVDPAAWEAAVARFLLTL